VEIQEGALSVFRESEGLRNGQMLLSCKERGSRDKDKKKRKIKTKDGRTLEVTKPSFNTDFLAKKEGGI